jgi:hypothetical protein
VPLEPPGTAKKASETLRDGKKASETLAVLRIAFPEWVVVAIIDKRLSCP